MIEILRSIREEELRNELEKVRAQIEIEDKQWNDNNVVPYKRFTWLQRNLTKRKEYKEYVTKLETYREMMDSVSPLPGVEHIVELHSQENELERSIAEVPNLSLDELGFTFESAVAFLNEHSLPVVLTENDKNVIKIPEKPYQGLDDIMLVHKTKYIPMGSHINSAKEAGAQREDFEYTLGGKKYVFQAEIHRNTVHFAANGEVGSVSMGNDWDNMKYIILIPFKDIPRIKILQAPPSDTYTEGGVDLTNNAWILCPKGQGNMLRQYNPGVNVIEYDAENAKGFAMPVLQGLGYNCEKIGHWNWENDDHDKQYREIVRKDGFQLTPHSRTKEADMEEYLIRMDIFMDMISNIRKDNLVKKPQDVARIEDELRKYDEIFWGRAWPINREDTSLEQRDIFYKRLEECGVTMPNNLKNALDSLEACVTDGTDQYISSSTLSDILAQVPQKFVKEFENPIQRNLYVRDVRDKLTRRFILIAIGAEYEKKHKANEKEPKSKETQDYDEF